MLLHGAKQVTQRCKFEMESHSGSRTFGTSYPVVKYSNINIHVNTVYKAITSLRGTSDPAHRLNLLMLRNKLLLNTAHTRKTDHSP